MFDVAEFPRPLWKRLSSVVARSSDPSIVLDLLVSDVDDLADLNCFSDELSSQKPSTDGGN